AADFSSPTPAFRLAWEEWIVCIQSWYQAFGNNLFQLRRMMSRRMSPLVLAGAMGLRFWMTGEGSRALAQKPQQPKWSHAFNFMVRKTGEKDFDEKKTQRFGLEVFKDTNTGYGLYISDKGSVGAAPGFDKLDGAIKDSKGAKFVSGLDLPAR